MIFVDTNVFMYAVGKPHPLQSTSRLFFSDSPAHMSLCTSAEVLQELAHAYLPVQRAGRFDAAMEVVANARVAVWPLEGVDVTLARELYEFHPTLAARDLCILASCRRRGVTEIMTFDQALAAAMKPTRERD